MTIPFNQDDRELVIVQLMMNTRYSEDALNKLSDIDLIDLYKIKVQNVDSSK